MYGLSGGVKPRDVIIITGVANDRKKKFTVNLMTSSGHVSIEISNFILHFNHWLLIDDFTYNYLSLLPFDLKI